MDRLCQKKEGCCNQLVETLVMPSCGFDQSALECGKHGNWSVDWRTDFQGECTGPALKAAGMTVSNDAMECRTAQLTVVTIKQLVDGKTWQTSNCVESVMAQLRSHA